MRVVSAEQMRELDRRTIEEFGTPGEVLMDRAGQGVAEVVARIADASGWSDAAILLLAGRGNNGGDAFAAARFLKEMGFQVDVWLAGEVSQVRGDALKHLSQMKAAKVSLQELSTKEDWDCAREEPADYDILVDGLLGTGSSGPPRGPAAGAVRFMNERSDHAFIVAIDMPSGLNADNGVAEGEAVTADVTVTMGLPKRGLVAQDALPYVGNVEVVDIGIPSDYVDDVGFDPNCELINWRDLQPLFPRRSNTSHKGDYGHVLLIGGAKGYAGAIAMAARAATRSGVGLVTVLTPASVAPIVAGAVLEAMVIGGRETDVGSLSVEEWTAWRGRIRDFDAVLVGPGMTRHPEVLSLVRQVLREVRAPLVVDADAISVFERQAHWFDKSQGPVVLTPHPGELARLFGQDASDVQGDRFAAARNAAQSTDSVVVLKGAGTVVAVPGRPLSVNLTGNAGMASGGSGDVLAGLLAGLLAQGLAPEDAAKASVYLHGRAGDMVSWQTSQGGLTAGDLIEELPYALRELSFR